MGTQISLKLSDRMFTKARTYAENFGFNNLQDFIRETLREKLFGKEEESFGGFHTSLASEKALAKSWLTEEEDEAWAHLQEQT